MSHDWQTQSFTAYWGTLLLVAVLIILGFVLGLPAGLAMVTWRLHRQKLAKTLKDGRLVSCRASQLAYRDGTWWCSEADECENPVELQFPEILGSGPSSDQRGDNGTDAEDPEQSTAKERMASLLDLVHVKSVFGSVYLPYRGQYYWWSAYEVLQRLVQSSCVLLVCLIDPDWATLYAMLVSFTSLAVHGYIQPYKHYIDNMLQLLVLYNHCLLNTLFIANEHNVSSGSTGGAVGYIVLSIHLLLSATIIIVVIANLWCVVVERNLLEKCIEGFRSLKLRGHAMVLRVRQCLDAPERSPILIRDNTSFVNSKEAHHEVKKNGRSDDEGDEYEP
eukprot:gene15436-18271_t